MGGFPRVSADGRYIVFCSDRTGSSHIWRMDIDGSNPKQLTNSPSDLPIAPDPSPDGKWVVYSKRLPEKGIWKVPMEGGDPVRLDTAEADWPGVVVSPDGKMIAYFYDDPKATPRGGLAIMAFAGGPPMKLFDIYPKTIRWTPDSGSLLYVKDEGGASNIWSQPIAGGMPKQITHFNSDEISSFDLSRDGKRLVMARGTVQDQVVLIRDVK